MIKESEIMQPQIIPDLDAAFPVDVDHLMPSYNDIPKEFKSWSNPYSELVSNWFFSGLSTSRLIAKDHINKDDALRHLRTILSSFSPKHEHKIAAVAYLMSQWFEIKNE